MKTVEEVLMSSDYYTSAAEADQQVLQVYYQAGLLVEHFSNRKR